ncbi:D-3-phosphoglycerate dehydrogenase-like [Helianthus annuus]|uniref:D-3-phosphoglycerate dehydrogenase-like n=1 Tax=Helianthus annuus TaxID=4232 RepID=UPI000B8FB914|nr:D-3-phosphoglycerate dehydrogenase-like [Helianthus annuus]
MTLGSLLALGYHIALCYKRASKPIIYGDLSISPETIDALYETYIVLRGNDRKMVESNASRLGFTGPWITKSYLEMMAVSTADFISLYMSLTPATSKVFNDATFAKMKKGVRIINVARGGVIDKNALLRDHDNGIIAQGALDVLLSELAPYLTLAEKLGICVMECSHVGF